MNPNTQPSHQPLPVEYLFAVAKMKTGECDLCASDLSPMGKSKASSSDKPKQVVEAMFPGILQQGTTVCWSCLGKLASLQQKIRDRQQAKNNKPSAPRQMEMARTPLPASTPAPRKPAGQPIQKDTTKIQSS